MSARAVLNVWNAISPLWRTLFWFRRSIHRKFAIAVLPIIVGTIILILGVDEFIQFRHDHTKLVERQYQIAEGHRSLISAFLSAGELSAVESLVSTIAGDPDVTFAAVKDAAGSVVASSGVPGSDPNKFFTYNEEFAYSDTKSISENGSLIIDITSNNIRSLLLERIRIKFLAILSLTIFLFILIRISNEVIVASPLNRMIDSIEANVRASTLTPIEYKGIDQIARFGRAYNAQTEQIRLHQTELRNANSRLEHMVSTRTAQLTDALSQAEQATQHATLIANQDEVTGLLNRRGFMAQLRAAVVADGNEQQNVVLFLLDLDRFKNVNDTLGHAAGDELLRHIGERLKTITRQSGTLGRVGGDEFALFVEAPLDPAEIAALANRTLEVFKEPIAVAGRPVHAGISIGISTFPDGARGTDQLMTNADIALYKAKDSGRGRFVVFNSDMALDVVKRDRIEIDLRRSIRDRNGIAVFFQPKVDLRNGAVVGFEALVRWRHDRSGVVGPDQFLPVASERGMMLDLSELIAENVKDVIRHWSAQAPLPFSVAINIHADQLTSKDHLESILETLGSSGLGMDRFILEITEGCILGRGKEGTLDYLIEKRGEGLKLSLDDFGTGFASLTHLKQFPMDELKIDKSFVQNLGKDSGDEAIIRAAVDLAHAFDMNVVAEGVETRAQLEAVLSLGCDQGQGYLFGQPADTHQVVQRFLETRNQVTEITAAA